MKRKSHKRTKSSQSSQTDFGLIEVNQLSNSEPRLTAAGLAEAEIKIAEKESEVPENTSQLHPVYICGLLILVGFNFAAFTTYYANSTIPCKKKCPNFVSTHILFSLQNGTLASWWNFGRTFLAKIYRAQSF